MVPVGGSSQGRASGAGAAHGRRRKATREETLLVGRMGRREGESRQRETTSVGCGGKDKVE